MPVFSSPGPLGDTRTSCRERGRRRPPDRGGGGGTHGDHQRCCYVGVTLDVCMWGVCAQVCVCACVYACVSACVCVLEHVCMHMCLHVCVSVRVCTCVCVLPCVCGIYRALFFYFKIIFFKSATPVQPDRVVSLPASPEGGQIFRWSGVLPSRPQPPGPGTRAGDVSASAVRTLSASSVSTSHGLARRGFPLDAGQMTRTLGRNTAQSCHLAASPPPASAP